MYHESNGEGNDGSEEKEVLVGHIPIELSKLINHFLQADDLNSMTATVAGKRKREQGLVVPSTFKCFSLNKKLSKVLYMELMKKKIFLFRIRCGRVY